MGVIIFWVFLGALLLPHSVSAGEMVLIPAGSFLMGSKDGEADERPEHNVYLDSFYMDRYPVTNAEYAQFLNACGNQMEEGKKWLDTDSIFSWTLCKIKKVNNRFVPRRGYENHPVVKVSWFGARAYARWAGKRLPTEAEWEKAARGGLTGKKYVYGDVLLPEQADIKGDHASTPVDFYPPNGYGIYMMVAGVWQWCSDWYDEGYYDRSPWQNPQGPETGSTKVLRGGSWFHTDSWGVAARENDLPTSNKVVREGSWFHFDSWRVAAREKDLPTSWKFCFITGFRCVRDSEKGTERP